VIRNSGAIANHLGLLFSRGTASGLSERDLLDRFLAGNDEVAFAAIVAQHGPMVLGVCRRLLCDPHEIEDAFQATFLVFVRRADTIRGGESVGRWLHGVARRVAVRARSNAARRRGREQTSEETAPISGRPSPEGIAARNELVEILDEELDKLPASLRSLMVLCYLEGLTHDEAAGRLGWPVGTVRSRLARARDTLRRRLSRRGVTADDAALTTAIAYRPVSSTLFDATVRASLSFTTQQATANATASAAAIVLARGVLHAMFISNLKIVCTATVACVLAAGGLRTYGRQFADAGGDGAQGAKVSAPQAPAEEPPKDPSPSVAKLQADLAQASGVIREFRDRIASLEGERERLQAELKSLRQTAGKPAVNPAGGVGGGGGATTSAGGVGGGGGTSVTPAFIVNPIRDHVYGPGSTVVGTQGGGMGAMGGGFGRGMGGVNAKNRPPYIQTSELIMVTSPGGEVVTGYSINTGKAKSLRLTKANDSKLEVLPLVGPGIAALYLKGSKISRIAAFSPIDGTWYPQELREPVDKASPIVASGMAAYGIGRRVYAFSPVAKRWDVLELPEGAVPQPAVGPNTTICEHNGHVYVFSVVTGTWEDIDTRATHDKQDDGKSPK
jgi:RNA polymerase sigma factor (sigma-70 family)